MTSLPPKAKPVAALLGGRPDRQRIAQGLRLVLAWSAIYAVMVVAAHWLPVPASDWYVHFEPRFFLTDYPPLLYVLLALLPSLPFLSGLTLTALLFCLWRRRANLWQLLAAFTAMPLYWTLWLGQVDAVPMLGLALLPWAIPLVMLKPQVGVWYVWAWWRRQPKKWHIAAGVMLFIILTLIIWGPWPLRYVTPYTISGVYNLSLWQVAWPLGLLALGGALLERDPDRALTLGALGTPYLQGTGYLLLLPLLARLTGWRLGLGWLASWSSLLVLLWGDSARPIAAIFPFTLWCLLAWDARRARVAAGTVPVSA